MKRTWIKLKRGVLDPKHVNAIGEAWPFFCYLLDRADWDTGLIRDYQDRQAEVDLGVHVQTIRRWRKRLETNGYIGNTRSRPASTITIYKWVNPKLYDENAVINPPPQTDQKRSLSAEGESDHETDNKEDEADPGDARVAPELHESDHAPEEPSSNHTSHSTRHTPLAPNGAADHSEPDQSAPDSPPPPGEEGRPPRALTPRQAAVKALEERFSKISAIDLPARATEAQRKTGAKRWWNPLAEIWEMCDKDLARAEVLLTGAYNAMISGRLDVSAPASILEKARAINALQRRANGHGDTPGQPVLTDPVLRAIQARQKAGAHGAT